MTRGSKSLARQMERATHGGFSREGPPENRSARTLRSSAALLRSVLERRTEEESSTSSSSEERNVNGTYHRADRPSELIPPKLSRREILLSLRQDRLAGRPAGRQDRLPLSEARQIFVDGQCEAVSPAPRAAGRRRKKISIIAWDVAHNPLGRAYVLADALKADYDVEIIGASFPHFGSQVWAPLRESQVRIRWFKGAHFPDYLNRIDTVARQIDADVLLVCKPRLPSLQLGIAAKAAKNRPLILDIDDYEMGFFSSRREGTSSRPDNGDYLSPYGEYWTRYCDSLIEGADSITVASTELQRRYGGTLVPHMRDETIFDPQLFDRDEIRREFGFEPDDRVILFVGTLRHHKGILEIVDALASLGNPKYRLCIIGSVTEPDLRQKLAASCGRVRIDLYPDSRFADLPRNLCIGDLICILQQQDSIISKYQMPAKFSDALAMEVPVLATDAPPLQHLARGHLVETLGSQSLAGKIDQIFRNYSTYKKRAIRNRKVFLQEYSYAAIRPRLSKIVDDLLRAPTTSSPPQFKALLDLHRNNFGTNVPRSDAMPGYQRDIVFFWKQNDSGLYGRRQEMLVKYLARDPRVRKILHFEPPMDIKRLFTYLDLRQGRKRRHNRLVFWQTILRSLGLRDSSKVKHRTFIYANQNSLVSRVTRLFLPAEKEYVEFVRRQLRKNGISADQALFWVCPTDFRFPEIARQLKPSFIVADLIDDNRTWPVKDAYRKALKNNYEAILGMSDLVLANNGTLRQSMSEIRSDICVVPNGVDTDLPGQGQRRRPRSLARLKGPIVGYVGNLDSNRIDVPLLEFLAVQRPSWQIVLIGSTHSNEDILRLSRHSNVHFMGVVRYPGVVRYARHFDVAIVPHLDNALTRNMHPLKLFLYLSLGLPIVASNIRNMELLDDFVLTAKTKTEFVRCVEHCLSKPRMRLSSDYARKVKDESWERRVEAIMSHIGAGAGGLPRGVEQSRSTPS